MANFRELLDFFDSDLLSKVLRVITAFNVLQETEEYQEFIDALEALDD